MMEFAPLPTTVEGIVEGLAEMTMPYGWRTGDRRGVAEVVRVTLDIMTAARAGDEKRIEELIGPRENPTRNLLTGLLAGKGLIVLAGDGFAAWDGPAWETPAVDLPIERIREIVAALPAEGFFGG